MPDDKLSVVGIEFINDPPCGVCGCVAGAGCVPRVCCSACVVGCTLCSVCPAGVTGRAFEPGSVACPCGLLPLGAVLTPLEDVGGVLPDGAGGGVVWGVPGCCCADTGFAALKRQSKSATIKGRITGLKLRRFITILSIADFGLRNAD